MRSGIEVRRASHYWSLRSESLPLSEVSPEKVAMVLETQFF